MGVKIPAFPVSATPRKAAVAQSSPQKKVQFGATTELAVPRRPRFLPGKLPPASAIRSILKKGGRLKESPEEDQPKNRSFAYQQPESATSAAQKNPSETAYGNFHTLSGPEDPPHPLPRKFRRVKIAASAQDTSPDLGPVLAHHSRRDDEARRAGKHSVAFKSVERAVGEFVSDSAVRKWSMHLARNATEQREQRTGTGNSSAAGEYKERFSENQAAWLHRHLAMRLPLPSNKIRRAGNSEDGLLKEQHYSIGIRGRERPAAGAGMGEERRNATFYCAGPNRASSTFAQRRGEGILPMIKLKLNIK